MINAILLILGVIAAVWVIYDVVALQKRMNTGEKVIWVILAFLFSIITAIIYYFVKKR